MRKIKFFLLVACLALVFVLVAQPAYSDTAGSDSPPSDGIMGGDKYNDSTIVCPNIIDCSDPALGRNFGFHLKNVRGVTIDNCIIINCDDGLILDPFVENSEFIRGEISNCKRNSYVSQVDGFAWKDSVFHDNPDGIELVPIGADKEPEENIIITDNVFTNDKIHGYVDRLRITGNQFEGVLVDVIGSDVQINNNPNIEKESYVVVSGSDVKINDNAFSNQAAVLVRDGSRVLISRNSFYNFTADGDAVAMVMTLSLTGINKIEGNTFRDSKLGVWAIKSELEIIDNTFENMLFGSVMAGLGRYVIKNNDIYNTEIWDPLFPEGGLFGTISLLGSSDSEVSGNVINNTVGVGIYLQGVKGEKVTFMTRENNIFENNINEINECPLGFTDEFGDSGAGLEPSAEAPKIDFTELCRGVGIFVNLLAYQNDIHSNIVTLSSLGALAMNTPILDRENKFWNNYFENTLNIEDFGSNIWYVTPTNGTNIVGGPAIGGNYYSDYLGGDLNGDGFGDVPYISGATNDVFPLVKFDSTIPNGSLYCDLETKPADIYSDCVDNKRNVTTYTCDVATLTWIPQTYEEACGEEEEEKVEDGLAWWAWLLIILGIVLVLGGGFFALWYFYLDPKGILKFPGKGGDDFSSVANSQLKSAGGGAKTLEEYEASKKISKPKITSTKAKPVKQASPKPKPAKTTPKIKPKEIEKL